MLVDGGLEQRNGKLSEDDLFLKKKDIPGGNNGDYDAGVTSLYHPDFKFNNNGCYKSDYQMSLVSQKSDLALGKKII